MDNFISLTILEPGPRSPGKEPEGREDRGEVGCQADWAATPSSSQVMAGATTWPSTRSSQLVTCVVLEGGKRRPLGTGTALVALLPAPPKPRLPRA